MRSATNRDLDIEVEESRFRGDLLYRLNVATIEVPPLRDRPEDIPVLASHFLQAFRSEISPVRRRESDPHQAAAGVEANDGPVALKDSEQQTICRALEFSAGSKRKAAKLLGIGEATLCRKMKKRGIEA